jgi:hypothetical protein
MSVSIKTTVCLFLFISFLTAAYSQQNKPVLTLWDGMVVAGYVNDGGFVNFGGPSLKLVKKPFGFAMGMLPTLRFKKDNVASGLKHNSTVTPTAGAGFTAWCKHLVVQVPFYYNTKTAATDGQWSAGIGIGYKF